MSIIIESERLVLRTWNIIDRESYYKINNDSNVIKFLRGLLTLEECENYIHAFNNHQEKYGYTLWAVELKSTHELIRFTGLNYIDWGILFTPAVEIGWRLGSQYWGKGYATEAAQAALYYGFVKCNLKEIVAFTVPANKACIRVMEKIGMKKDIKNDFYHPKLSLDHPLSLHVLYPLTQEEWKNENNK